MLILYSAQSQILDVLSNTIEHNWDSFWKIYDPDNVHSFVGIFFSFVCTLTRTLALNVTRVQ